MCGPACFFFWCWCSDAWPEPHIFHILVEKARTNYQTKFWNFIHAGNAYNKKKKKTFEYFEYFEWYFLLIRYSYWLSSFKDLLHFNRLHRYIYYIICLIHAVIWWVLFNALSIQKTLEFFWNFRQLKYITAHRNRQTP